MWRIWGWATRLKRSWSSGTVAAPVLRQRPTTTRSWTTSRTTKSWTRIHPLAPAAGRSRLTTTCLFWTTMWCITRWRSILPGSVGVFKEVTWAACSRLRISFTSSRWRGTCVHKVKLGVFVSFLLLLFLSVVIKGGAGRCTETAWKTLEQPLERKLCVYPILDCSNTCKTKCIRCAPVCRRLNTVTLSDLPTVLSKKGESRRNISCFVFSTAGSLDCRWIQRFDELQLQSKYFQPGCWHLHSEPRNPIGVKQRLFFFFFCATHLHKTQPICIHIVYTCVRGIFIKMELTYCYLFQSILLKKCLFFIYLKLCLSWIMPK